MTDPAADVERIIRRIVMRRMLLGLTQRQAAGRAGVWQGQLSDWEDGRSVPSAKNIARYARAVGLRLAVVDDNAAEQTALAMLGDVDPALPAEVER